MGAQEPSEVESCAEAAPEGPHPAWGVWVPSLGSQRFFTFPSMDSSVSKGHPMHYKVRSPDLQPVLSCEAAATAPFFSRSRKRTLRAVNSAACAWRRNFFGL